ncbi:MAG: ribonuclease HII [Fibrobacterota bacterium]
MTNTVFDSQWKDRSTLVGVDEAGRGPLAGPVVAAAVILNPETAPVTGLNDSKKLTEAKRESLFPLILENAAAWGIHAVSSGIIDEINILQATFLAMEKSIDKLNISWKHVLVDGNHRIPTLPPTVQTPLVGGDGRSAAVAAASILAKVTRDRIMRGYDRRWPQYGFAQHKGYGTKAHKAALTDYGLTSIHRRSFCRFHTQAVQQSFL